VRSHGSLAIGELADQEAFAEKRIIGILREAGTVQASRARICG
jgi:hypothetical protein